MKFLLSSQNAVEYLVTKGLCTQQEQAQSHIEPKVAKNFNLLLSLPDDRQLLIKQERYNRDGKTAGEFLREWRIHEFVQHFPELSYLRPYLPEILHFDAEHSIIVFNYLNDYRDLAAFYAKEKIFSTAIATSIGTVLATIHRATLDCQEYRDFFIQPYNNGAIPDLVAKFTRGLERITPEIFGQVPHDGLKFLVLYQRYDSLGKAIAELHQASESCCLTHNDLKLNNILLPVDWEQAVFEAEQSGESIVRLIDWERSAWGDPAFDLGTIIGSYLQMWLSSLVTSKAIALEESLRLATLPLDMLQPSIAALASAYFKNFPEILDRRPNFLKQVVQFSGLALIQAIQATIQHQKVFNNTGICMLQVAKSLLCHPEQSTQTVFGIPASELISHYSVVSR
ncbi:phosphotransferase [Scytonema sp. UIC 10036]|uniref:phosphotransferase family protein n=1 Tax=Scytonema sp. UIC 10036 TaxID=2304196 RepID=UPI0012DA50BD|nr:aminoglycoside phosphotransferase family protein [Scytonema sp. UIC 10036]MUG94306.1 phosphotransferase [Scytonema sp. UIC 10036]